MDALPRAARRPVPPDRSSRCSARCSTATANGADGAQPPTVAIVDWREVPTWTEFEILRDAFIAAGVPTVVCDPRDLEFDGATLAARRPAGSISSTAACSSTTSSPGPTSARRWCAPTRPRAVCVANTFRCKLPHKKAFFAVLTDPVERAPVHADGARGHRARTCRGRGSSPTSRPRRTASRRRCSSSRGASATRSCSSRTTNTAARACMLGWESDAGAWDAALEAALGGSAGRGSCRSGSRSAARVFPQFDAAGDGRPMRDMLVDLAPYPVPRPDAGLSDAPERDRPRQRDVGRRAGAVPSSSTSSDRVALACTIERCFSGFFQTSCCRAPHNAVQTCLGIKAGRARRPDRRRGQPRRCRGDSSRRSRTRRRSPSPVLIESVDAAADATAPPRDPRRARAGRRRHPLRAAAGRGARRPDGDRRGRRAAADPLRAHGRRDAADHARRDARGLPAGRSAQPGAVRAHAARRRR